MIASVSGSGLSLKNSSVGKHSGKKVVLVSLSEDIYGRSYKEHLLEQYKLYVASAEKISDRRQNANNYFLAINTAFISLFGLSLQIEFLKKQNEFKIFLPILGFIVSVIFWILLRSYKQLNTGKFKVIHEIEKRLPLSIYGYEWYKLDKGEKYKTYFPFSKVELLIPVVFGVLYIALGLFFCLGLPGK